jgi:hypothetical protein
MANLPHIQFYVGDWRKDIGIQSLSYHHRGVWFELLLLMHCSEQRGRLTVNGRPMSNGSLARLLGMSEGEAKDAVDVLIANGVASREANGAIVNRRMVREEEIRQKRKTIGSRGGSKTAANREPNPYQTPDNDNDNDNEKARSRVREFARGEGIGEKDADWFFFKCEGNGWTNGGKPIRDWKATIQTWWRAGYFPSQRLFSNNSFGRGAPLRPARDITTELSQ